MKSITHGTLSEPRYIASASILAIIGFYLLSLLMPANPTMKQVEDWSTIAMIGTLVFLFVSTIAVHKTVVHTYIFFLACMSLFIGGRYIAHALGFDPAALTWGASMFSIHMPFFMVMDLSEKEAVSLSMYIVNCLLAMHAGYMFSIWKKPSTNLRDLDCTWASNLKIPAIALAVISTAAFLISFPEVYKLAHSEGYASQYQSASDFTTRGSTAAQYGLLLALGLAFASRTKWLELCVLGLLAIYYFANLKVGIRGGIMGFALLSVWLFHTRVRKIDRLAIIGIPVILSVVLLLPALGLRSFNFGAGLQVFIPWFIDNQGHTALYVHIATNVEQYPLLAYVHSIFPATPTIASMLGTSIPLDQLYFGQYISKEYLTGDAYKNGLGMGWSVLSDFYAYTLWIPGLYLFAAAAFGAALSRLASSTNQLVIGAHIMLFVKIMLLPRTGLYSVIPFIVVYAGIIIAFYILNRIMLHKSVTAN